MLLQLLETNFIPIDILETFESLIWTECYYGCSNFEISTRATPEIVSLLTHDRYLTLEGSDRVMEIEDIWIHSSSQNGNKLIVKGRSLEQILDRRIIPSETVLNGNLQDCIAQLLDKNAINPVEMERKIDNFRMVYSDDPLVTTPTIKRQFTGDYIYDAIYDICLKANLGFKITLSQTNELIFELYAGADRSYDQYVYPFIEFSPKFDNLINSDYRSSNISKKTYALVAGEGEGSARVKVAVSLGSETGLKRREMFVDARDLSKNMNGGITLSDQEYIDCLTTRGEEYLSQNQVIETFEGEVDPFRTYVYGKNFFIGDIVQVINEYGHTGKTRVIEFIRSQDNFGLRTYPTFSML